MKRSAALREETHWSVTTPEDRAKIQEKISQTIRQAKTQPVSSPKQSAPRQDTSFSGKWNRRVHDIREGWSERAGDFSQRAQNIGRAVKEQVSPSPEAELWKGVAAGLAAGLIGTFVMTQFMTIWSKAEEKVEERLGKGQEAKAAAQPESETEENSTVKVASAISENVFNHKLQGEQKKAAGNFVHFGYGTLMGGVYGVLSELYPKISAGHGSLYGTALWVGGDTVVVPALGLSQPPQERSAGELAYEAAAHLVYGVVTETVRGALKGWLD